MTFVIKHIMLDWNAINTKEKGKLFKGSVKEININVLWTSYVTLLCTIYVLYKTLKIN